MIAMLAPSPVLWIDIALWTRQDGPYCNDCAPRAVKGYDGALWAATSHVEDGNPTCVDCKRDCRTVAGIAWRGARLEGA